MDFSTRSINILDAFHLIYASDFFAFTITKNADDEYEIRASSKYKIIRKEDLELLKGIPIRQLNLSNSNIVDASPLRDFTSLRVLNLTRTNVSDLTPISGLINLTELYISKSRVTDISPVETLINLKCLSISHLKIKSLTPISNLINLIVLFIDHDTEIPISIRSQNLNIIYS